MKKSFLLLLIGFWAFGSVSQIEAALGPSNVGIIAMESSSQSKELAEYYAVARGIPREQILLLPGKPGILVSRKNWETKMRPAIRAWLQESNRAMQIRCLVTVWDVPLKIHARPADSPEVETRKTHLIEARAESVRKIASLLGYLEAAAQGRKPISAPGLSPDEPVDQLASRFDGALKKYQQVVGSLPQAQQRQAFTILQSMVLATGGNQSILSLYAAKKTAEKKTSVSAQQALFAGKQQAYQETLQSLERMPDTPARDESILEVTQSATGLLGGIRWIDEELAQLEKNETLAAFDDELALVLWPDYALPRWLSNPWHYTNDARPARRTKTLMVSRLAAPKPQIVKRMIDESIAAERTGLDGIVYLDARGLKTKPSDHKGSYATYDESLRLLAKRIQEKTDMKVVLDNRPDLFAPGRCPEAAIYCGWYSVGKFVDSFTWRPGAIGYHIASYEANWLQMPGSWKDPNKIPWCPGLLEDGAAATLGAVTEPYLLSLPKPDPFFSLLLTGKVTLAEAFHRTKPFVSWRVILIGDPLYMPFKNNPKLRHGDLPPELSRSLPAAAGQSAP